MVDEWKKHNLNGPAIIRSDGTKKWYQKGELHRLDGPAIIRSDGTKKWYQKGKLHHLDSPAIKYSNGKKNGGLMELNKKNLIHL
jgi:predicted lipoprotein with Yx(FWY)xxD motif